jgi:hypothetical protein
LEPSTNRQILGKLGFEAEADEDDMAKLERIFTKMVNDGKINKKQLVKKLMHVSGYQLESSSNRSIQQEDQFHENLEEDISQNSHSRIAIEEQRQRHKISNTNSNFYKFKS